jgi:hypothetical protein
MLVRVSLLFTCKGCAQAPAAIHEALGEQQRAWRESRKWGGTALAPWPRDAPMPAGRLLGFVSNGGYDRLRGRGTAVAFCAATPFVELLRAAEGGGQVLVLVRSPCSRQFRPALAAVRP